MTVTMQNLIDTIEMALSTSEGSYNARRIAETLHHEHRLVGDNPPASLDDVDSDEFWAVVAANEVTEIEKFMRDRIEALEDEFSAMRLATRLYKTRGQWPRLASKFAARLQELRGALYVYDENFREFLTDRQGFLQDNPDLGETAIRLQEIESLLLMVN